MKTEINFILEINEDGSWALVEQSSDEKYIKDQRTVYEWKYAAQMKNNGWKFRILRSTTTYEVIEKTE